MSARLIQFHCIALIWFFFWFGTHHVHRITHESLKTYFQCGPDYFWTGGKFADDTRHDDWSRGVLFSPWLVIPQRRLLLARDYSWHGTTPGTGLLLAGYDYKANHRKRSQTTANHHKLPQTTTNQRKPPQTTTRIGDDRRWKRWKAGKPPQTTANHCKPPPEYE